MKSKKGRSMTSDKTANRGEKRQIYPTYRKMTTEE
jgi:hypothetical protein